MRGERGPAGGRDRRHNKDESNLKSSLKKGKKPKPKHRVVFDESANEFFEADYIIVVRDECYSDGEECGACERFAPPAEFVDAGALSPPEGYKDMGLFNRDGTLREQAWWEAGGVALLVGERSGTVFTPQHLQLLRRLQRERLLRATLCADCDAHAALHQPLDIEYGYEEEETSDADSGREAVRPAGGPGRRAAGKHIAAGEERPRTNSSQQTTPTDECVSEVGSDKESSKLESCATQVNLSPEIVAPPVTSEDSDTADADGRQSTESSPRARRSGILKGGRLWKSFPEGDKDSADQADDQHSTTTASDEDGSQTPRSVRFYEEPQACQPRDACDGETDTGNESETSNRNLDRNSATNTPKEYTPHTRLDTPLILTNHNPKATSAVRQLFNSSRPPPPAIEPHLVTSESLRAWDADRRAPRSEEVAVRRAAERNALRCSLLRSEARKKTQPKTDTTSLAERIRLLTCDVDDDPEPAREERASPAGASVDKPLPAEKAYSVSSSSSSSNISVPMRTNVNAPAPDLAGDLHHELKHRPEPRRQFLSTLAPLTACVGSAAHHEGFYYVPPGDRGSASPATDLDMHVLGSDAPAPDVVAGTPGAMEGDDGLAAFARAAASRNERLRQRYQESQPPSSDDEHDDYGFHRRPAVRGIKPQAGSNDILQQMQSQMQPTSGSNQASSQAQQSHAHSACPKNANYSWAYYSESNLAPSSRAVHRTSSNTLSWAKPEYVTARCGGTPVPSTHADTCSAHAQPSHSTYVHSYHRGQESIYQNCSLYANVRCADSSQDIYNSHTSSEQTSPVRADPHRQYRRPESPPPIRNYHHTLMYIPYNNGHPQYHYNDMSTYVPQWNAAEYNRNMQLYYQQQQQLSSGASTPQPASKLRPDHPAPAGRLSYPQTLPLQVQVEQRHGGGGGGGGGGGVGGQAHALCPVAAARYRTVSSSQAQSGSGQQMICYSERVQAPLYQPAPGSPSHVARGAPEGAPAAAAAPTSAAGGATSPLAPPAHNSVYYAMNV